MWSEQSNGLRTLSLIFWFRALALSINLLSFIYMPSSLAVLAPFSSPPSSPMHFNLNTPLLIGVEWLALTVPGVHAKAKIRGLWAEKLKPTKYLISYRMSWRVPWGRANILLAKMVVGQRQTVCKITGLRLMTAFILSGSPKCIHG